MDIMTKEEARAHETIHRLVHNKNNLQNLFLRRSVAAYDKELLSIIRRVDEERLDWMEFIKNVKHCESDHMPEFDWAHKKIHENPPSPIDLLRLSNTKMHLHLPPLPPPKQQHTDTDQTEMEATTQQPFRHTHTAPDSKPQSREVEPNLERSKTDAVLISGRMERAGGVDRLVLSPTAEENPPLKEDASQDVLTNLPSITRSSRLPRGVKEVDNADVEVVRRLELRKATSELELRTEATQDAPGPAPGLPRTPASGGKAHFSTSDIPDAVRLEARNTVLAVDEHSGIQVTPECFQDTSKRRRKQNREPARPLTQRVDDFFSRFDSWMKEDTKPKPNLLFSDVEELPEIKAANRNKNGTFHKSNSDKLTLPKIET